MRIPRWAKNLWAALGHITRIRFLLTLAGSGAAASALLAVVKFFRTMPPVLQAVTWVCVVLIIWAVVLYLLEMVSSVPEGRAQLEPRYEPHDPMVGAPKYERTNGFGNFDYFLGVFNRGPSIARNVMVRAMDVYSNMGEGGPARITGIYPRQCRRIDTSEDDRLINPGSEALYAIGRIRDFAKESGLKDSPRTPAFYFDWPTGWPPSGIVSEKPTRLTFHFETTAENADPVTCKLVFRGEAEEIGHHYVGELESG